MFNRWLTGLIVLLAAPVVAAPIDVTRPASLPASESAVYDMRYLGISCGEAHASWEETGRHYTAALTVKTGGIAAAVSSQDVTMTVSGNRFPLNAVQSGERWRYVPASFHFVSRSKKKPKEATVRYDASGRVVSVAATPDRVEEPDDVRPAVSTEGQNRGTDPLTLLLWLGNASLFGEPNPVALQYDGVRLTRLTGTLKRLDERGQDANGKVYALGRSPIEGYTPKELDKQKNDSNVTARFRSSVSRFPDLVTAGLAMGTLSIVRVR